ncbi:GDSL esterase/lipase At1g28650 isoform X2 [Elaeis guineensis]|uniref:GDSL esterase/lipase At1g28650 isoform X2 n=1 Tax=Elaeis guineensis var. tenera TaxID=51953 RepID=A0A6I9QPC6_ELAGV|nr:GDSL esterase/lipase At1g28650 isoform X2 [Elaeis guineensis]
MAASTFHLLLQLSSLLTLLFLQNVHTATTSCCTSIFSFGDSLADTGNFLYSSRDNPRAIARLPYGETYFHRPTGRYTDGRLIIDFIAQDIGIPLVPPYLEGPGDHGFRQGVNFAVAGATALDNDFFREKGLDISWTEYSLGTQIEWFKQLLPSLCSSSSDCKGILSSSLFLMGEIGGNDYNHPFFQGRTVDEIRTFVPSVISAISSAINVLIQLGAKTMVVPGNFPIGCVSRYLQTFQSQRKEDYDSETGCIKWLNEFAEYHNRLLVDELDHLRQLHPHVTIIYADYYEALLHIFRFPTQFGFKEPPLAACCGAGGPYNVFVACGDRAATVCNDPSKYVCWDGIHLTEAAYGTIAQGLLEGSYATPPITQACAHIRQSAAHSLHPMQ